MISSETTAQLEHIVDHFDQRLRCDLSLVREKEEDKLKYEWDILIWEILSVMQVNMW